MRFLAALVLLFVISLQAHGKAWSEINSIHPLWEALNVPETLESDELMRITRKAVGGVICSRQEIHHSGPHLPMDVQIHCVFPKNPTNRQALSLYKALNVKPIDTNSAYEEIKVVDRLVVVGSSDSNFDYNSSRYYLDHACQSVTKKSEATECMKFWGTKVLPSFNAQNDVYTVSNSPKKTQLAAKTLSWSGYADWYVQRANESLEKSDFIGMMAEYQDEYHFNYYAIKKGKNSYPVEVMSFNTVDVEYTQFGENLVQASESLRESLISEYFKAFFLGTRPERFEAIYDDLKGAIESLLQQ